MPLSADVAAEARSALARIQSDMFARGLEFREQQTHRVDSYDKFREILGDEGGAGFLLAHWDGTTETELRIQSETGATIRCIPLGDGEPGQCMVTGQPSPRRVVFARAY